MRAAFQLNSVTGQRVRVGTCDCRPGWTCGLCVQVQVDPPERPAERLARLANERRQGKDAKRENWRRRVYRLARKGSENA